jgi:hypothetical protein
MQTTEIILRDNGTLTERVIRERNLNAEQSVLEALTEGVNRVARNVMTLPDWGMVSASVGLNNTLWTVAIDRIPLNARFRLINNILVPAFASATDIEMPLVWRAPKEVRLAFVVRTELEETCIRVTGNWLFACDADKRGYRLPLPNLHDDCLICTGNFDDRYPTSQECIAASLEQFRKSKWNADLMRTIERSQQFFRFNPTDETFETLPVAVTDWTTLCDKVSTDIMERVVI